MAGAVLMQKVALEKQNDASIIKIGDTVLFATDEQGEEGFLSSGSDETTVIVRSSKETAAFEIVPQIHYAQKEEAASSSATYITGGMEEGEDLHRAKAKEKASHLQNTPLHYQQIFQLRHIRTGKFLAVVKASELSSADNDGGGVSFATQGRRARYVLMPGVLKDGEDNEKTVVVLRSEGSEACWFVVKPRFMEEGELKVQEEDQVVLEHFHTGQYIHLSSWTDEEGNYEVDLSSIQTGWKLIRHEASRNLLQPGSHIRLFHQLGGLLLSKLTARAEEKALSLTTNALSSPPSSHTAVDTAYRVFLKAADSPGMPFSAIWVVEPAAEAGGVIGWGQPIRLRLRVAERPRYLAMVDERLVLAEDDRREREETLFTLQPAVQSQGARKDIPIGAYVRLRTARSDTEANRWVHVDTASATTASRHDKRYFEVVGTTRLYEDTFTLQPADVDQVDMLQFVQSRMPLLAEFIRKLRRKRTVDDKDAPSVLEVLREFICWCTLSSNSDVLKREGVPIGPHQNLLSLYLESFVAMLAATFEAMSTNTPRPEAAAAAVVTNTPRKRNYAVDIVRHTYRLLKQMAKGNFGNGVLLARHVDMMQTHLLAEGDNDLGILATLLEMFRDNTRLVARVTPNQIGRFIEMLPALAPKQRVIMLDLLSALCACDDVARPHHQNVICQKLLLAGDPRLKALLVQSRVATVDNRPTIEIAVGDAWIELATFLSQNGKQSAGYYTALFFRKMLILLSQLCIGRNTFSLHTVPHVVTAKQAVAGMMDRRLPVNFRAAYCWLVLNGYVDRHPLSSTAFRAKLWPVVNGIDGKWFKVLQDAAAPAAGPSNVADVDTLLDAQMHEQIKKFLLHEISDEQAHVPNELRLAELLLIRALVKFGIFTPLEVESYIIPSLIKILAADWTPGVYGAVAAVMPAIAAGGPPTVPTVTAVRSTALWLDQDYLRTDDLYLLFLEIKIEACRLLELQLALRLNGHFRRFVQVVAEQFSRGPKPNERAVREAMLRLLEADLRGEVTVTPSVGGGGGVGTPIVDTATERRLAAALVGLCEHRQHALTRVAMKVLQNILCKDAAVRRAITHVQFLCTSKDVTMFHRLTLLAGRFGRLAAAAAHGVDAPTARSELCKLLTMLKKACKQGHKALGDDDVDHDDTTEPQAPLSKKRAKGALRVFAAAAATRDVRGANQQILRNTEIYRHVIDLLKMPVERDAVDTELLFEACYAFLRAFCKKNATNQRLVFEYGGALLLSHLSRGRLSAGRTLIAVFRNNPGLCAQVEPVHLYPFLELLATKPAENGLVFEFMQQIIAPNNVPLRKNQILVTNLLMASRRSPPGVATTTAAAASAPPTGYRMELFSGDDGLRRVLELARCHDNNTDPRGVLAHHLSLVDTLSLACLGRNQSTEAVAQQLLSLSQCFAVLTADTARDNLPVLATYAHFVDEVWVNTEVPHKHAERLQDDPRLWRVLETFSEILSDYLRNIAASDDAVQRQRERAVYGSLLPFIHHFYTRQFTAGRRATVDTASTPTATNGTAAAGASPADAPLIARSQELVSNSLADLLCEIAQLQLKDDRKSLVAMDALKSITACGFRGVRYARQVDAILGKLKFIFLSKISHGATVVSSSALHASMGRPGVDMVDMLDHRPADTHDDIDDLSFGPEELRHPRVENMFSEILALIRREALYMVHIPYYIAIVGAPDSDGYEDALRITCLQLLRNVIEREREHSSSRHIAQFKLDELGVISSAMALLRSANTHVVAETLKLLVAVIENGGEKIHWSVLQHFFGSRDETFFRDVRRLFKQSLTDLKARRFSKQRRKRRNLAAVESTGDMSLTVSMDNTGEPANNAPNSTSGSAADVEDNAATADVQRRQDPIALMFRFLRLLCAGNYPSTRIIQNYLRIQEDNYKSYDLLKVMVGYLAAYEGCIDSEGSELAVELVSTLKEAVHRCPENKHALVVEYKACTPLYHILRRDVANVDSGMLALKLRVMELLITCLEGTLGGGADTAVPITMISMMDDEDFASLKARLDPLDERHVDHTNEVATKLALESYRWLTMLGEVNINQKKPNSALSECLAACNRAHSGKIGRIEIVNEQQQLERVYFPVPARFHNVMPSQDALQESLDLKLLKNPVKWRSPTKKIETFCRWAGQVLLSVEHRRRLLDTASAPMKLLLSSQRVWHIGAMLLTFLITILVLVFMESNEQVKYNLRGLLYALAALHVICSVLVFIAFTVEEGPIIHWMGWRKYGRRRQKRLFGTSTGKRGGMWSVNTRERRDTTIGVAMDVIKPFAEWTRQRVPSIVSENSRDAALNALEESWNLSILATTEQRRAYIRNVLQVSNAQYVLRSIWLFVSNPSALWRLGYVVFSILGLVVSPLFFAYHLFDIVAFSEHLRLVTRALAFDRNPQKLALMSLLILIIVYAFSVIGYAFMEEAFLEVNGLYCSSPIKCLASNLLAGITTNGGIYEFLDKPDWHDGYTAKLIFYDMIFYFVVGVLLINVVFALIVDTFGKLRDDKTALKQERFLNCFICSIESDIFQKTVAFKSGKEVVGGANRFTRHIQEEHNRWYYLFFFAHLKEKVRHGFANELTDAEKWVLHQIKRNEWSFFPIERAIVLEENETQEENEVLNQVTSVVDKRIAALTQQITLLSKKLEQIESYQRHASKVTTGALMSERRTSISTSPI